MESRRKKEGEEEREGGLEGKKAIIMNLKICKTRKA